MQTIHARSTATADIDHPTARARTNILTLPGIDNSCERHWQSHWEVLDGCRRVQFGDWAAPTLHGWVPRLEAAVAAAEGEVILAAHSLGCIAAAWWAALCRDPRLIGKVRGALLVAPADVDRPDVEPRLRDFRPTPMRRLPFPSLLVASRNDPYAGFARSAAMARAWGSELVDLGQAGHINAASGLGEWSAGLRLLGRLDRRDGQNGPSGQDGVRLIAQLGLRKALS